MRTVSVVSAVLLCMVCSLAGAKTLTFVGGFDRPPYVIQASQSGFELELIEQVSSRMGYESHFTFSPFGRSSRLFKTTDVDAITTMNRHTADASITLSDVYVTYENVIVTKAKSAITLDSLDDLHTVSLAAFHNARVILGEAFGRAVSNHASYIELDNQETQVSLFWQDRVEALVIDINVFHYLSEQYAGQEEVTYHTLFTPTDYRIAFRDARMAEQFNQQLALFREMPAFQAIKTKFLADMPQP